MTTRKKRMTKAEIASAQYAAEQAEIRAALRWLDEEPPKPDIPKPDSGNRTTGWCVVGGGEFARATKAWSRAASHGTGSHEDRGYASQQGRALYSSEVDALRAARHEASMSFARKLWEIDKQIAKAEK